MPTIEELRKRAADSKTCQGVACVILRAITGGNGARNRIARAESLENAHGEGYPAKASKNRRVHWRTIAIGGDV